MKKILVVEDEYYARKSIVKILQESDLDIQVCGEAANGMKAIELLEEYKDIALVITDIQMQKMGGLELASYLHKHIPEIDVLILTAFENFDYAREALRYNVKDYIVKPIYKENLLPPVKKVLEKQEEKSRNQEKIKNYYQWEAAKNYFPVKTIVTHEELYKEFFSYNAIHQEEKFCIVVMQEEELVTDVELVNRIIQEKYRGFIKDFFFSKINEEYVMLLSGIECMDNELIVQEKVESMLSYFCTCKHMNITMGVGLVYSSKEKIYQSYNEALYALNQRLIQGWNRAYFYKNMDGYKARIGKEAEIKLESIVRTRKEKEINQVIHSILEDIIIKEESAQKLYMAVVEILKILGNYYAELYQDEDIEELKDIKVMFSRRYDLYKFKHIEELENYLKEMVIVICSGKENTKKKSKIVEEIVHYVENNYYKNISLRELAENKYFVNYSYCSRLFSQETGMNFSKYLIQYRLKKAKTLLENKDMAALEEMKRKGYIRYVGVSNFTAEQIKEAEQYIQIDVQQPLYSMVDRGFEDLMSWGYDRGIDSMTYGSMGAGILSGKIRSVPSFEKNDLRLNFYDVYKEPKFSKIMELLKVMDSIADGHNVPVGQVALNWSTQKEYVGTALVGVRSIEHADENCKTFDWKLTEEEMKILDSKIEECAL